MTDVALQVGTHVFLHGTVVLGVAWLIARYVPNLPASSKHAVWTMAFGVLLLLPVGNSLLPGWNLRLTMEPSASADVSAHSGVYALPPVPLEPETAPTSTNEPPTRPKASDAVVRPTVSNEPFRGNARSSRMSRWFTPRWFAWIFAIVWAGGALTLGGRIGVGMFMLWQWKRSAETLKGNELVSAALRKIGLDRPCRVLYSSKAHAPIVWGPLSPVIVLPENARDWPAPQLESVLLHELAHVKRRDPLTHLLSRVTRAFFWPNPLIWLAVKRAKAAQEQACDDAVLRSGIASWEYAKQLLAVAKTLRHTSPPTEAVAIDTECRFKSRMRALLDPAASHRALTQREIGVLVATGALLLTAASTVQMGPSSPFKTRDNRYWVEAEDAVLPSAFAHRVDETALHGAYVHVTEQAETLDRPPQTEPATYVFETSHSGRHLIWARVRAQSDSHNSFWLRMDSTRWIRWNGIEPSDQWHWEQVRDADQDDRPVAFDLAEGNHRLQLAHREAGVDIDQLVITNAWNDRPHATSEHGLSSENHQIWLEAEDGEFQAPFRVLSTPNASNWRCIVTDSDASSRESAPATGHATYSFTVSHSGTYRLWGRVIAPSEEHDSFWIRMDEGPWIRWNQIHLGEQWHWDLVHDAVDGRRPVEFKLSEGEHRLTVAHRESRVRLDRLLLTSRPTYQPRGVGKHPDTPEPFTHTLDLAEAELDAPMVLRADTQSTPSFSWIGVPDGSGNDPPDGGPGAATWTFSVPQTGDYVVWGEVAAPVQNDNSFYVSVDEGEEIAWHTPTPDKTTDDWQWDPVSGTRGEVHTDPVVFSLEKGHHRLRIRNREDGTLLRRLRVTNAPVSGPHVVTP